MLEPVTDPDGPATPPKPPKPVMDPVMRKRVLDLFIGPGVNQATFDRLYHKAYQPRLYGVDVELRMLDLSDPEEVTSFRRFYAFYEALVATKDWERSVEEALLAVPKS